MDGHTPCRRDILVAGVTGLPIAQSPSLPSLRVNGTLIGMETLLTATQVEGLISDLTQQILADPDIAADPGRLALVGIRRRGEIMAQRIGARLQRPGASPLDIGALDITMYRDDTVGVRPMTIPMGTVMNFRLDDRPVVLFDDVLHTGRSVRAALDGLVDFGRPRFIRLAVLIDRGGREYPIRADFVGRNLSVPPAARIRVYLKPTDPCDEIDLDHDPGSGEVCR